MGMDFKTAGSRVRDLIAAKKPHQLSTSALTPDQLRDNVIAEAEQSSARFAAATDNKPVVEYAVKDEDGNPGPPQKFTWETFDEAIRDVARAAFGYEEPALRDRNDVRPSHQFNREVVANVLNGEKFNESRPYTRNNELESMFGAMALAEDMRENAAQLAAEHVARSEQMREQEGDVEDAETLLENLRQQAKNEKDETGKIDPNTVAQAKQAVQKRQQALGQLGQLVQQHAQSNAPQAAAKIAASAAKALTDAVDAAGALGSLPGSGPGQSRNLTPDKQLALAEKWSRNKSLREVLRMAGRMIRDMRFKREARTKNVPIEPVDVTTGRDLPKLLPHEQARAYRENLRMSFLNDYARRSLLEYEYQGKTPAGHGPLIVPMDCSGSMDLDLGGASRREWAGSLALALLTLAKREKRAFAGIHFGSQGELKTWFWDAKQEVDAEEVVEYVTHTFGGGTDYATALAECLRIVQDVPEFSQADIVMIGDGQDGFGKDSLALREELRKTGVRSHCISIACPNNAYMQQLADYPVIDVSDIANDTVDHLAENIT